MSAHEFEFESIDGESLPLSRFRGHPVLIVNTASECGYTPQYEGLQALWRRYKNRGLVVVGVPSNDFGAQEPGDENQIEQFCRLNYGIDFPMTSKVSVLGGNAHPFYRWVESEFGEAASPRWNFHKYLIGPDGTLVGMWPSDADPRCDEIMDAIEELL
ncbi:MAG TPA: glutathione peroxidase [Gammaproteobacteria bacterium]|nr:glutathione peroxidase [Gammaproteobacteria bacterium]